MAPTVRLKYSAWPRALWSARYMVADPTRLIVGGNTPKGHSECVAALRAGTTFKTTWSGRHTESDAMLLRALPSGKVSVVDVGASDGSTSLELIDRLGDRLERYWVTDTTFEAHVRFGARGAVYFCDAAGAVLALATQRFVLYPGRGSAITDWLLRRVFPARGSAVRVPLAQAALLDRVSRDARVELLVHDVFEPWSRKPVDVVKVANLWTRWYFDENEIVLGLRRARDMLAPGGLLLLIDSMPTECSSLFRREGAALVPVDALGGGWDLAHLVSRVQ